MGSYPLVSCIIPVFNAERFLDEAVRSALAQTYPALEIIVVNDGSTDGSEAVLAKYQSRVACILQPNRGEAAARNTGVRAARGEFVAFLDADDMWEPEKIGCQVARWHELPVIDLCFTRFQNFWMHESPSSDSEAGNLSPKRKRTTTSRRSPSISAGIATLRGSRSIRQPTATNC